MYEKKESNAFSGKELLGVEEVAAYLGVKQTTIYRWCREGRMSCFKIGKSWRIRPAAVEEFLSDREQSTTLYNQLKLFLDVPTSVVGIAQDVELLHLLDAAFLRVGEERGGLLVKFHGGEPDSVEDLRKDFSRNELDVYGLEREGRLIFSAEKDPLKEREGSLREILEEEKKNGEREVWASFDWVEDVDLDAAIRQQQALTKLAGEHRLAVKTALLEQAADDWTMATQRRAQAMHSGLIWVSNSGLALSRMNPVALK